MFNTTWAFVILFAGLMAWFLFAGVFLGGFADWRYVIFTGIVSLLCFKGIRYLLRVIKRGDHLDGN